MSMPKTSDKDKLSRKVMKLLEEQIAGKQRYKCANKPGANLPNLENFKCPLWKIPGDRRGIFDESGYTVCKVNDDLDTDEFVNMQVLCPTCYFVKNERYAEKQNKNQCNDFDSDPDSDSDDIIDETDSDSDDIIDETDSDSDDIIDETDSGDECSNSDAECIESDSDDDCDYHSDLNLDFDSDPDIPYVNCCPDCYESIKLTKKSVTKPTHIVNNFYFLGKNDADKIIKRINKN